MPRITKREAARLVEAYGVSKAAVESCDPTCPGWFADEERNQVHRCDDCGAFDGDLPAAAYVLDRLMMDQRVRVMVEDLYRRESRATTRAVRAAQPAA